MQVSHPTDNRYKVGVRYSELPPWAKYSNMVVPRAPGVYVIYELHEYDPPVFYSWWAYWNGAGFASRSLSKKHAWERRKDKDHSDHGRTAIYDPESLSMFFATTPTPTAHRRILLCTSAP